MNVKNVFIFLLGACVGAGSMYLVYENKILEKKVNEELRKIKAKEDSVADKKENSIKTETKEETPVDISEESKNDDVEEEFEEDSKEDQLTKYSKVIKENYAKISKSEPVTTMTEAVEEEVNKMTKKASGSKKTKVPKKVTQDEFDATALDERKELYFYADGVLADIDTDEVLNATEIMGATNLKQFKANCDTVVYIFNYATGYMYEITYSNSTYADATNRRIDNN